MWNISVFPLDVREWMWQYAYECWWDEVGELREVLRDYSVVGRKKKKKTIKNPNPRISSCNIWQQNRALHNLNLLKVLTFIPGPCFVEK